MARDSGSSHSYSIGFDSGSLMHTATIKNFTIGRCIYDVELQHKIVHEAIRYSIENEVDFSSTARRWDSTDLSRIFFSNAAAFSKILRSKKSANGG
jgi:hypothetical protein